MDKRQIVYLFCLFFFGLASFFVKGQGRVIFTATVASGDFNRQNSPVFLSLENILINTTYLDQLQLFEIKGKDKIPVPFQLEPGNPGGLWWILSGVTHSGTHRIFVLQQSDEKILSARQDMEAREENGGILLSRAGKNVLRYQYQEVLPPPGKTELFQRGGFIHPMWSPKGEILTRIQPPDHYHHFGIWNPWTRTTFEGRKLDFWNLYEGQGTIKVGAQPTLGGGQVFAQVGARHEHVDLTAPHPSGAKTALHEDWRIRAWNPASENGPWVVDFSSTLHCATDSIFTINAYRYQGFGFRATEKWNDNTSRLLTSEGKDKSNGNGTRARWIDVRGTSGFGKSGILFLTHPLNYNYPEQLRIWPTGMNEGKENVFINFNPAQEQDWVLQPGRSYGLNYRMVVYDGELAPEVMEQLWQDYTHPPKVEVILRGITEKKRVLVYTKNGNGYVHDNRSASVEAIKKLGRENGFEVDASENPSDITEENLKKYHAIILSNTNNETFDTDAQKLAFQRYVQAGGGLVGIHSASGSERKWPWFWRALGGKFRRHPPLQPFDIHVLDTLHPSTIHLGNTWAWQDECYYLDQLNPQVHVLLSADMTTIEDDKKQEYPATNFGNQFPLAWCQETPLGRSWYTALGHKIEYYSNPDYLQHLLGGILWVLDGTDRLDYSKVTDSLVID